MCCLLFKQVNISLLTSVYLTRVYQSQLKFLVGTGWDWKKIRLLKCWCTADSERLSGKSQLCRLVLDEEKIQQWFLSQSELRVASVCDTQSVFATPTEGAVFPLGPCTSTYSPC
jgi:hypothetical protein